MGAWDSDRPARKPGLDQRQVEHLVAMLLALQENSSSEEFREALDRALPGLLKSSLVTRWALPDPTPPDVQVYSSHSGEIACAEHRAEAEAVLGERFVSIDNPNGQWICDTCMVRDRSLDRPIVQIVTSATLAMQFALEESVRRGYVSEVRKSALVLELHSWMRSLGILKGGESCE